MNAPATGPSPEHFFATATAYQRSFTLKGAIELDLFTAIAEGRTTVAELAAACQASERGIRILCDYLVIIGFLTKQDGRYGLTQESELFLNRHSPAFLGNAVEFLLSPMMLEAQTDLASAVRRGGTVVSEEGTMSPENDIWVKFARGMMGMTVMPAQLIAQRVGVASDRPVKVLDIAAGHGNYGLTFARQFPNVEVTAVDWPNVLQVARENAQTFGVAGRFRTIEGSAFEVDLGTGYDIVLLCNFLHHFDPPTNETLLRKLHAALKPDGRVVTLEFIPNDDRVSPPLAAAFSMMMLSSTAHGDAYTFAEFEQMFRQAGFARNEFHDLAPAPQQIIISSKQ